MNRELSRADLIDFFHQITNIKKTLKSTQQQGNDEQMVTDSREIPAQSDKPSKKSSKTKGWVQLSLCV